MSGCCESTLTSGPQKRYRQFEERGAGGRGRLYPTATLPSPIRMISALRWASDVSHFNKFNISLIVQGKQGHETVSQKKSQFLFLKRKVSRSERVEPASFVPLTSRAPYRQAKSAHPKKTRAHGKASVRGVWRLCGPPPGGRFF